MSIWLDSIYELAGLVIFLAAFVWLAKKRFGEAIGLIVFFLPLYLLKIKIWFVPSNVLEIMIGMLFLTWLFKKKYQDVKLANIRDFSLPALLILNGAVLSALFSQDLAVSAGILKSWFVTPLLFAFIVASEIKSGEQVKKILSWLAVSGGAVALVGIIYFLNGKVTFDNRLTAFFLSPNQLAMYLVPGFLTALLFFVPARTKVRLFFLAVAAICGVALFLTYSYAAWLAAIISAAVWLFFRNKNKKKTAIFIGLFFLILMGALLLSQLGSTKLNDLLHSARSSGQSRLVIWRTAGAIGLDHPIFGIGPGMFQEYYLRYQSRFAVPYLEWAVPQPHNLLLAFWLQTGLFGLAGFLWLIILFFRKIIKPVREQNLLALTLAIAMSYFLLHGLVDTTYFKNDLSVVFWLMIALVVSLLAASKKAPAADPPHLI